MNTTETLTSDEAANVGLARAIHEAARHTSKRFGERKAFICGIADEILPKLPKSLGMPWLARRLIELNRQGLIELSRADLVGAMDPEWVTKSEVRYLNAEFHFVNIP